MRVTFGMMKNSLIGNINKQSEKLLSCENKVASGKEVAKPSDNPRAAAQILSYRAALSSIEQYQKNITTAKTWIELSDTNLDMVQSLLDDAIDVASNNLTAEDGGATAREQIESLYEQILDLANARTSDGGSMYAGNQTRTVPFGNGVTLAGGVPEDITFGLAADAADVTIEIYDSTGALVRTMTGSGVAGDNTSAWDGLDDGGAPCPDGEYSFAVTARDAGGDLIADYPVYRGDDGPLTVKTSKSATVAVNNNGDELFGDLLKGLNELMALYENGDDASAISACVAGLESAKDGLEISQSEQAIVYGTIETRESALDKEQFTLEQALSGIEDADQTQAAVELEAQKTSYEACLESVSSILEIGTLIDRIG